MARINRLGGWWLVAVFVLGCGYANHETGVANTLVLKGALAARSVVTFTYKGQARTVEPHALGKGTDEKPVLLAWQTAGGSNTEPPPGWRVFIVANITDLKATDQIFEKSRGDPGAKGRGLKSIDSEVAKPADTARQAAR